MLMAEIRAMPVRPFPIRKPARVRLRRTKGWRLPAGAIKVDRTTRWGNPWRVGVDVATREQAVNAYRAGLEEGKHVPLDEVRRHLAGHDLACWCKPGDPCHADVLLEIANQQGARSQQPDAQ